MSDRVRQYQGRGITVSYDVGRCIHAAKCVRGLPAVFDPRRRPWINPMDAEADAVAAVIACCPTGALHFSRQDGGTEEPQPPINTITVSPDGPLYLSGRIEIASPDGQVILKDTRVTLCRCGASKIKPYCDGSHTKSGFKDAAATITGQLKVIEGAAADGGLKVTPSANGPFIVQGPVELRNGRGELQSQGNRCSLCRCGASNRKPFCDGSHAKIGFVG